MLVLGINGGYRLAYQDVSACLVENGMVLAAIEEERLSRVKFSPGKLPYLSVLEVLKIGEKKISDVNLVAFHGSTWESSFEEKITEYFKNYFGFAPPIKRFHHHDCHAASTYFASGYSHALIITLDNSGDGVSLQVSLGKETNLEVIQRFERPNSLGIFYSLITQYCGFVRDSDEYKVMGLSSYGNRYAFDFSWLINFEKGILKIDQTYIQQFLPGAPSPHRDEMLFSEKFIDKMKFPKRIPGSEISDFYKDVAASAQYHFENLILRIAEYYCTKTEVKNLCLAGGAALNCVANQQLMNAPFLNSFFVQPASGDSGISLGAAWMASLEMSAKPVPPKNYYTGKVFSNVEVENYLKTCGINYQYVQEPWLNAAKLIAENKVIGWFQGGAEFGPRALGNRSILANPCNTNMQQIVNEKIKFREGFRPFCPSVLEEDAHLFFEGKQPVAPHMTITYDVKPEVREIIPAVTHVDGTARIQTVNKNENELFYKLLLELKKINGYGVVLNTSFNLSHEPMVYSPQHALATFYSSGLDVLFLSNFMITK